MKTEKNMYEKDFKSNAVLLFYESGSHRETAKQLGIPTRLLRHWQKDYEEFGTGSFPGRGKGKIKPEDQLIQDLEKKIKILDLHFEILKNARAYIHKEKSTVFEFISLNKTIYSIRMMCEILDVHRTSHRKWEKNYLSVTEKRKLLIQQEITQIFHAAKQRYGSPRIRIVLQKSGYYISETTVKKYMNELGLSSKLKNGKK